MPSAVLLSAKEVEATRKELDQLRAENAQLKARAEVGGGLRIHVNEDAILTFSAAFLRIGRGVKFRCDNQSADEQIYTRPRHPRL
jgi:hypothetical protein